MKKINIWAIMLVGCILLFQACKDDDNETTRMDNQEFVTMAASGNMLEIQAGQLATQKGVKAEVKSYGEHMVNDHTTASLELSTMAQRKGLTVPAQLTTQHQQQLAVLAPLAGENFDKAFMSLMVKSHQEQVSLFERASTSVNDKDLRSLAAKKLPVLKEHLQEALALNATVNP
jgi:putative membrane protein